jgi:hypothetical protein
MDGQRRFANLQKHFLLFMASLYNIRTNCLVWPGIKNFFFWRFANRLPQSNLFLGFTTQIKWMEGDNLQISKNKVFIFGHTRRFVPMILHKGPNNKKNIFGDWQINHTLTFL